jgi:hypothetical protein
MMIKIISIKLRGGYRLLLRFADGSEGERDFCDLIEETGSLVKPLRDLTYFAPRLHRGWHGSRLAEWSRSRCRGAA